MNPLVIVIPVVVVLAAVVLFAASRRRDVGSATGALSRETIKRDKPSVLEAESAAEVPVSGTFRANNGDALCEAALAGLGIVYQPTFLFSDDLRAGRLVPIVLDQPPFQYATAYAVYAPSRHVPAKVRRFIDFLVDRWAGVPPWDVGLPPEIAG